MRCHPGDPGTDRMRLAQVVHGADARYQQDGDRRLRRLLNRRGDQVDLVGVAEPVVERGAAQAVPVGHLDHLDTGSVERVHGRPDLSLGELVRHRMTAVAQGGVGDPHRTGGSAHAVTLALSRATSSPTRAAAAVMMSRLPA
jgi:hypothetical protein